MKPTITVRLSDEVMEGLRAIADLEDRPLTYVVERTLRAGLDMDTRVPRRAPGRPRKEGT